MRYLVLALFLLGGCVVGDDAPPELPDAAELEACADMCGDYFDSGLPSWHCGDAGCVCNLDVRSPPACAG